MVNIVYAAIGVAGGLTIVRYLPIERNIKVLIATLIILWLILGRFIGYIEI
ncbi:MAG: hypothetical protein O8C67_09060 [Candidatus Methanoperedens sp.]|nr:hypothetical protein [Candidatus Methanoperedens sp.]